MKKFMEEFKAFALRGNVMDMAVGVIIWRRILWNCNISDRQLYQSDLKSFDRRCNLHYDRRCRICI